MGDISIALSGPNETLELITSEIINPSKRKLQSQILGRACRNLRRYRKDTLRILCLPGITGWDIELFRGICGDVSIVALEDESKIFESLHAKHSSTDTEIINVRTSEFLATTAYKFDIIYLDYFTNLSALVRFDVDAIFRRRLLTKRGKLIINMYGARETITDCYTNQNLLTSLYERYGWPVCKNSSNELSRCRSFNALIMKCRLENGSNISCPKWAKYKSGNAFFYTTWMSFNGNVKSRRGTNYAAQASPHLWSMKNSPPIREIVSKSFSGTALSLHRRGLKDVARNHWKALVIKFYSEHHRTPTCEEVTGKKSRVKDWHKLLRELGLCPLKKATSQDLLNELKRIEKRDGVVSWESLRKAQIQRKLGYSAEFGRFCKKHGVTYHHDAAQMNARTKIERRIRIITSYIEYLDNGGAPSFAKQKSTMKKMGAKKYSVAVKRLGEYKASLAAMPQWRPLRHIEFDAKNHGVPKG